MIAGCELVWRYDRSVLIGVAIQSLGVNWCGNTIARCEWALSESQTHQHPSCLLLLNNAARTYCQKEQETHPTAS